MKEHDCVLWGTPQGLVTPARLCSLTNHRGTHYHQSTMAFLIWKILSSESHLFLIFCFWAAQLIYWRISWLASSSVIQSWAVLSALEIPDKSMRVFLNEIRVYSIVNDFQEQCGFILIQEKNFIIYIGPTKTRKNFLFPLKCNSTSSKYLLFYTVLNLIKL